MPRQSILFFFALSLIVIVSVVFVSVPYLLPSSSSDVPPIENVEKVIQMDLYQDDMFIKNLKKEIRDNIEDAGKLNDSDFEQFLRYNHKVTSDFINTHLTQETVSLFSSSRDMTLLKYTLNNNKLNFSTNAEYYTRKPVCKGVNLDFEILAASNFGLRGYCISNNSIVHELGEHNTAYFSTCYDPQSDLVAFAIRGLFRIDIYNRSDWSLVRSIDNIAASTIEFYRGDLFIGGYYKGGDWDKSSIFQYSVDEGIVTDEFYRKLLADTRGLSFHDGLMAVSDSYHNRIVMRDLTSDRNKLLIKGFSYPNGIHLISHDRILVADEHNNHVRLLDLASMSEIWTSPAGQLKSPGSVYQVQQGNWAGMLLISDTDNNRVIVVEPKSWKIIFEVSGIRGVLKSVPVFRN